MRHGLSNYDFVIVVVAYTINLVFASNIDALKIYRSVKWTGVVILCEIVKGLNYLNQIVRFDLKGRGVLKVWQTLSNRRVHIKNKRYFLLSYQICRSQS